MKRENEPDRLEEIYIARQPLLSRDQILVGVELKFHDTSRSPAVHPNVAPGVATADLVCKAFAELGLAAAFGDSLIFLAACR